MFHSRSRIGKQIRIRSHYRKCTIWKKRSEWTKRVEIRFGKYATKKEMKNVEVAFKFLDDGTKMPIGFKKITCHLIFDVNFDLTRKARYVGGGHLTQVSPSLSYSSVVSQDSVRIMFLVAALNDLDVKMCDIGNTYLNAETRERLCFTAGQE